jgi:hypothetical protein
VGPKGPPYRSRARERRRHTDHTEAAHQGYFSLLIGDVPDGRIVTERALAQPSRPCPQSLGSLRGSRSVLSGERCSLGDHAADDGADLFAEGGRFGEDCAVVDEAALEQVVELVLIEDLSLKYTGRPYPGFAGPDPQWATVRITADKVTTSWPTS